MQGLKRRVKRVPLELIGGVHQRAQAQTFLQHMSGKGQASEIHAALVLSREWPHSASTRKVLLD